jgi:hypothetical protein
VRKDNDAVAAHHAAPQRLAQPDDGMGFAVVSAKSGAKKFFL